MISASTTVPFPCRNCHTNGGFESGSRGWFLHVNGDSGAIGTVSYPSDGAKEGSRFCRIKVTRVPINEEQNNWHVQLRDPVWTSIEGREYNLTFWAIADSASRRIHVSVHGDGSDVYAYREGTNVTLSTDWNISCKIDDSVPPSPILVINS